MTTRTYSIDRAENLTLWQRLYLPAILQGMMITGWHLIKNMMRRDDRITIEYPEVKKQLPPGYRAEHRLMQREDGSVRCTACMLCATICPARCIEIEAEDVGDDTIEKRPKNFTINELRCVFCGLCVEACPCDAIRMDT
ncbi:MAG: NADH-quinone oxidoreductase subunit I, partial [Deltaproteobacteria bacterium]|nr:NADH-quinone oxidoreductase subunit I [Deltaproteobacteria bacterium]